MPNLGNTCYINAVLQALLHIKPFRKYFLETFFRRTRLESNETVEKLVYNFTNSIWCKKTNLPNVMIKPLTDYIIRKYFNAEYFQQRDCVELLQFFLNDLEEALKVLISCNEKKLCNRTLNDDNIKLKDIAYKLGKLNIL